MHLFMDPVIEQARPHRDIPLVFVIAGQHAENVMNVLTRHILEGIGS